MSASKDRFRPLAAVHLLLIKDNTVLLLKRYHTGWHDGSYTLLAGHLDGNETVVGAMAREAKEEACIDIDPDDLHVVHTMHRKSPDAEYIDLFLIAEKWKGEPKIGEPEKCNEMAWFPLDSLPGGTLNHVRSALECFRSGVTFSEFGWKGETL